MKKKLKSPKKLILEQIKYFRIALDNLEYNVEEFEQTVNRIPSHQLDADEDDDFIEEFMSKLQELGDDASCINSYVEEIERIFTGE